jgi:hypothetical protein
MEEPHSTYMSAIDKVKKLEGVKFRWRDNDEESMGVIAQDIEKIFPELVETNPDGYKMVDYNKLIMVLLEAVQEQQKEIERLKN